MSRKGSRKSNPVNADPKFRDVLVQKFINKVMLDGKKSVAEEIVYGAFDLMGERGSVDPYKLFKDAVEKVKPVLEVRSRRVGGATYQVPVEVRPERKVSLALKWIVTYARQRGEKSMRHNLASELMDAATGTKGGAIKKREDVHRMAEANKAFSHYRW